MSLLKSLTSDSSIENEKDVLGGGSRVFESGLYPFKVAIAYVTTSASGALGLVLQLKSEDNRELRQTLWMTSGKEKGGKNFYEKDGEKHYLPGYLLANALSLLTVGKEISDLDTEQKVINAYSIEAKADVPTKVDMITDLLGQEIIGAVFKQVVNKTKKGDDGKYYPTSETREENELDKFFRARDKMTVAEIRAQVAEPIFYSSWNEKWTGKTRERAKGAATGGTAGAPKAASPFGTSKAGATGTAKPSTSLFS